MSHAILVGSASMAEATTLAMSAVPARGRLSVTGRRGIGFEPSVVHIFVRSESYDQVLRGWRDSSYNLFQRHR